jgi:hypothetical protein
MVALLIEDNEQTLTHREALRLWPADPVDRLGVGLRDLSVRPSTTMRTVVIRSRRSAKPSLRWGGNEVTCAAGEALHRALQAVLARSYVRVVSDASVSQTIDQQHRRICSGVGQANAQSRCRKPPAHDGCPFPHRVARILAAAPRSNPGTSRRWIADNGGHTPWPRRRS